MSNMRSHGGWIIIASFLVAYVLMVVPLPRWLEQVRPDWVALVLVYWCIAVPQRVGVGVGWLTGLLQDAIQNSLLGQHALAYALLAYLTLKLHQRVRVFPLWQQAVSVMVLLLLTRVLVLWSNGFVGRALDGMSYSLGALAGAALWPVVFILMRELRQSFDVR
jgi:rod shape-determining protein MreD